MQRLEIRVRELEQSLDEKDKRAQILSQDVKNAEDQVLREQRQRQNAQEQVLPNAKMDICPLCDGTDITG